jgi:membrane dipeptidase
MPTPIVDAHLDMAGNVLIGRDYDLTAAEVQAADPPARPKCMVTLPELQRGGVAVSLATLYVGTTTFDADGNGVYSTPPDESAREQLRVYLEWEEKEKARIIRTKSDLDSHLKAWEQDGKLGVIILIEGGDSITSPDDLPEWFEAGVRVIGPAWSQTRYCGGTRRPGPLTAMGRELIAGMRDLGIIFDASHIAEQSFWDAIDVGPGRIIASHSNAREIVPGGPLIGGDRQLTDDMIRAIGEREGVIGLVLFNGFLTPEWEAGLIGSVLTKVLLGPRPGAAPENNVTLEHVRAHAEHIAGLIGWHRVGIGSDFDGGLGVDESPLELTSAADLVRIGDIVPADAREGVLGGNWLRLLSEALPS